MSHIPEDDTPPTLPDLTGRIIRLDNGYHAAGGFGDVHKHQYEADEGVKDVAVKVFRFPFMLDENQGDRGYNRMIRRELGLCRRLCHPNIVPFLGIVYGFGMNGNASLVSLWMPNGTLQDHLAANHDRLTVTRRLELLSDIAEGLNYLHSFPIMHGDLKDNNVLLDGRNRARIADFGNSPLIRTIPQAAEYYLQATFARPGTVRWTAPELCTEEEEMPPPTTKIDIYSFGNLALVVMSGKLPWAEIRNDIAIVLKLARGETPSRPQSLPISDPHWDLIKGCWSKVAERPSAEEIVSSIREFLQLLGARPILESAPVLYDDVEGISNKNIRVLNDRIRQIAGKFINFSDPPIEVGAYGILDENGEFIMEGSIYDPEFQSLLHKSGLDIMKNMPEDTGEETDYIVASSGVRNTSDWDQGTQIGSGLLKGTWKFPEGKRGVLIWLLTPRMKILPREFSLRLHKLFMEKHLQGKVLVTSVMTCPGYLVYLSGKSGKTLSIDQTDWAQHSVSGNIKDGGWMRHGDGMMRKFYSPRGEWSYAPLFSIKRPVSIIRRFFR